MANKQIPEDYILVPKAGQTANFTKAFNDMVTIAQGKLGWRGQAEMMVKIGVHDSLGIKFDTNLTEEELIQAVEHQLQQCFLQDLYEYGEWLPPEEAKKRLLAEEVLYGKTEP